MMEERIFRSVDDAPAQIASCGEQRMPLKTSGANPRPLALEVGIDPLDKSGTNFRQQQNLRS